MNKEVSAPKFTVGTNVILTIATKDGKNESVKGIIKANNTIDFSTLTAMYDIEIEKKDIDGTNLVLSGIPESIFEKDKVISNEKVERSSKRNTGRAHR